MEAKSYWKGRRVLVTGGAGFIGSHVCDLLLAEGAEVMAFDRLLPQVHGLAQVTRQEERPKSPPALGPWVKAVYDGTNEDGEHFSLNGFGRHDANGALVLWHEHWSGDEIRSHIEFCDEIPEVASFSSVAATQQPVPLDGDYSAIRQRLEESYRESTGIDPDAVDYETVSVQQAIPGPIGARPAYLDPRVRLWVGDTAYIHAVADAMLAFHPTDVIDLAAVVGVGQSWGQPYWYLGNTIGTATVCSVVGDYNRSPHAAQHGRVESVFVAGSMASYGEGPVTTAAPSSDWPPGSEMILEAGDVAVVRPKGRIPMAAICPVDESYPQDAQNPYALSKRVQEEVALMLAEQTGARVMVGRFFNVYGPRQSLRNPYTGVAAMFAARLLCGAPPVIFDDGSQSRDFIHVEDVARAVLLLCERGEPGGVYNVATGHRTSVLWLAQGLWEHLSGGDEALRPVVTGRHRKGDIYHCYGDATRLRALGWEPQHQIQDGLADLAGWVKAQLATLPTDEVRSLFEQAERELELHRLLSGGDPQPVPPLNHPGQTEGPDVDPLEEA